MSDDYVPPQPAGKAFQPIECDEFCPVGCTGHPPDSEIFIWLDDECDDETCWCRSALSPGGRRE